jgi:hypothetical protein
MGKRLVHQVAEFALGLIHDSIHGSIHGWGRD